MATSEVGATLVFPGSFVFHCLEDSLVLVLHLFWFLPRYDVIR